MRRRKKNKNLPECMYLSHGKYYLVKKNKWTPLSRDYAEAMGMYASLVTPKASGGLDNLIDRTLDELRPNIKKSTLEQYEVCARKIKSAFRNGTPETTKSRHIMAFLDHHRKTPNMANRMRTVLKMAFDNAVLWGQSDYNPVFSVPRFEEKSRDRYITDIEYKAIRAHAAPHIQLMMDLAYITGQRIGDIINLKRTDIKGDTIYFRQQKTGNRVEITAEGINEVVQAAINLRKVSAFTLFHRAGKPYNYFTVRDAFKRATGKAEVENVQFRDIRAKSATDAEELGLNATLLLGHSDTRTTRIYLRKKRTIKAQGLKVLGSD